MIWFIGSCRRWNKNELIGRTVDRCWRRRESVAFDQHTKTIQTVSSPRQHRIVEYLCTSQRSRDVPFYYFHFRQGKYRRSDRVSIQTHQNKTAKLDPCGGECNSIPPPILRSSTPQILIQRAMNVFVIAFASSTRPSSSSSCTLPRIPDSRADATGL